MKNALAIVTLSACIVPVSHAASPPPVPESLLACRKLEDDGERVRCYDAQIAKLMARAAADAGAPAPTAPAAAPGPAAAAPAEAPTASASSAARFGEDTLPPAAHPKSQLEENTALLSSITALRKSASGTFAISLANGQVWRQEESSQVVQFFRVGDDVRIERAALGSYHMSTTRAGSKNWVRVTRVQ